MKLIDTHAHVNFNAFKDDAFEVIRRALDEDIGVINLGSQTNTSQRAVEYAEHFKDEPVWAAVGLHPTHLDKKEMKLPKEPKEYKKVKTRAEDFDRGFYEKLAGHPKVVAIGETGLDYPLDNPPEEADTEKAVRVFEEQLRLAKDLSLPVVIHSRGANRDILKILEEFMKNEGEVSGVVHFFAGTKEEARRFLDLGFLISFTGVITFAKEYHEVVRWAPMDKIMVETDSPYVSPVPRRGKRNEPINVKFIAEKIAGIKGLSFEKVAEQTTKNARNLFGLS